MSEIIKTLRQNADLEFVHCNLCGQNDTKLLFKAEVLPHRRGQYVQDEWDIIRCKHCGLVYLNPRPGPKSLDDFYAFLNPGDLKFVEDFFIDTASIQDKTWKRLLRSIQKYCAGGKLLEVGCGPGGFLEAAREVGFDITGQEISPYFHDYGQNIRGLNIVLGKLEEIEFPEKSFDCIVSFDVIEHHPDPNLMVKTMQRLLKPGGLLVIGTHDIGSWTAKVYGKRWRYISPTGHLNYFSRATIEKMVVNHHFSIIRITGQHTVDSNLIQEILNTFTQFSRLVILRSIIIYLYKPLSERFPSLTHWEFNWRGAKVNHQRLLMRAGKQVAMNDNLILFARSIDQTGD